MHTGKLVTRAKKNMDAQPRCSYPVDRSTGVRFDQTLVLQGYQSAKDYSQTLRGIQYKDPETAKRLLFIERRLADVDVRVSPQVVSGDLVHCGSPRPLPCSTRATTASTAAAPLPAPLFAALAPAGALSSSSVCWTLHTCIDSSLARRGRRCRGDRALAMSSRRAISTAAGMRAVAKMSCRDLSASVIQAGTASGRAPARVSPTGCRTRHVSSCTAYRHTMRNRSPARGWKGYRITTSARRVCWVVGRPLVQMGQTAPSRQGVLRHN